MLLIRWVNVKTLLNQRPNTPKNCTTHKHMINTFLHPTTTRTPIRVSKNNSMLNQIVLYVTTFKQRLKRNFLNDNFVPNNIQNKHSAPELTTYGSHCLLCNIWMLFKSIYFSFTNLLSSCANATSIFCVLYNKKELLNFTLGNLFLWVHTIKIYIIITNN